MRAGTNYKRMAAVMVLCIAAAACGGSSPTSPSQSGSGSGGTTGGGTSGGTGTGGTGTGGGGTTSNSCRIGPATYRIVTTGGGFTSTINGTCTFNNNTVEGTCTNQYTDTTGQAFTSVSTTRHASRGDVVDEIAVIPPLQRSLGTTTTVTGGGLNSTGTSAHTYDAQRRLVSTVATSTAAGQTFTSTTTFTAWDSAGRPTASVASGQGAASNTFSYDNGTRTQVSTTVGSGVSCSQVFDANGIPTVGTCSNNTSSTFTTLSTLQVCR